MLSEAAVRGAGRDGDDLVAGQSPDGDAEVAQDGVQLADRPAVGVRLHRLFPRGGDGPGGVADRLRGCGRLGGWLARG